MSVEVIVGTLGRAHGIRGDISVDVRTDEPGRRFAKGAVLRIEGDQRSFVVRSMKNVNGRTILSLEGVDDRTAAEQLTGAVLVTDVDEAELPSAAEEFFDRQLVGLTVHDRQGAELGEVVEVVHGPAQDLLVIDGDGQAMVPFVEPLVPDVDLAAGRITLSEAGVQVFQSGRE